MTTVMIDIAEEYCQARLRISGLTRDLEPEELRCPVPACPGWSVHDVVAHLSGAAADVVNGNMENAPRPEWIDDGEQGARLDAPSVFELIRAMTGRRSVEQIRAWSWEGDAESYLSHLSVFEPRPQPLEE